MCAAHATYSPETRTCNGWPLPAPLPAAAIATHIAELVMDVEMNIKLGENARNTILWRYDVAVTANAFLDTWRKLCVTR